MSEAKITCWWQRTYNANGHSYLLTLDVAPGQTAVSVDAAYPQARAVVDDFGSLVIVSGWK